jgi:2-haloacid dehalogenase
MQYLGAMRDHAASGRGFVPLDVLHRGMLEGALRGIGVEPEAVDPALLADWTLAWHRLDPWPDVVEGLTRLKRHFPIVALSNGNIALVMALGRRGGLPWDAVLGAEVTRAYKPDPEAYLGTARILGLEPDELCLVAAHHSDLAAARACGLATAFVSRPMEYGGRAAPDVHMAQAWDWAVDSLTGLADVLGC